MSSPELHSWLFRANQIRYNPIKAILPSALFNFFKPLIPMWLQTLQLPQSKTYYVAGGRRKFVFDCGVIGFCPLCTRATPLAGVGSLLVGGWGREPCAHAPNSKPTRQQGSCALLMGGWGAGALPRVNPPANRDPVPCWWVGVAGSLAQTLARANPPTNRDSVPCWQGGEVARILHYFDFN